MRLVDWPDMVTVGNIGPVGTNAVRELHAWRTSNSQSESSRVGLDFLTWRVSEFRPTRRLRQVHNLTM
jgi:hypothetical protein